MVHLCALKWQCAVQREPRAGTGDAGMVVRTRRNTAGEYHLGWVVAVLRCPTVHG